MFGKDSAIFRSSVCVLIFLNSLKTILNEQYYFFVMY